MIVIGVYVLYIKKKVVKDVFDFFLDLFILMMIGGVIVVFIIFFGCMGVLRENVCFFKIVSIVVLSLKKCKILSCLVDESKILYVYKYCVL